MNRQLWRRHRGCSYWRDTHSAKQSPVHRSVELRIQSREVVSGRKRRTFEIWHVWKFQILRPDLPSLPDDWMKENCLLDFMFFSLSLSVPSNVTAERSEAVGGERWWASGCLGSRPIRETKPKLYWWWSLINRVKKKKRDGQEQSHGRRLNSGQRSDWYGPETSRDYPFSKECPLQLVKYTTVL